MKCTPGGIVEADSMTAFEREMENYSKVAELWGEGTALRLAGFFLHRIDAVLINKIALCAVTIL